MNNRRKSKILLKVIDEFFKRENKEIQEKFRKHLSERYVEKKNCLLRWLFFCFVLILFVVGVFMVYNMLCFTITNQK